MRWTKRLRYRWPFLGGPLSSPEEQPAEATALAASHAIQVESSTAVSCAHCHRARRNPHQVRAGRARARTAARDQRGRFMTQ
jgi:hypothetical protein